MRRALAALSALGAVAVIVAGARQSWPALGHRDAHATATQAQLAPAVHEQLPVATFRRWRSRLHAGDRWWLAVPPGAPEGLTDRGAVYRAFATYYFLPALPAASERQATVVFRLDAAR